MLLPFWTDGCIGSMEGLYFEASATTPYHFLNQDELSTAPVERPARPALRPGAPDRRAVRPRRRSTSRCSGVKYYMAISDAHDRARPRATRRSPRSPTSGPWVVFEVADSELVDAARQRARGARPASRRRHDWLDAVDALVPRPEPVGRAAGRRRPRRLAAHRPPARCPSRGRRRPPSRSPTSSTGNDSHRVRRQRGRRAGAGEDVVLPELAGRRGRGPLAGRRPNLMVVVPDRAPTSSCTTATPPSTTSGWFITLLGVVGLVLLIRRRAARPARAPAVVPRAASPSAWRRR